MTIVWEKAEEVKNSRGISIRDYKEDKRNHWDFFRE